MPSPVPPPPPAGGRTGRQVAVALGLVIAAFVVAVAALMVTVVGGGSSASTASGSDTSTASSTTAPPTSPSTTEPTPSSSTTSTSSTSTTTAPAPTAPPSTTTTVPPPTAPPPAFVDPSAMVDAFAGYVDALDVGDLDGAYAFVSPRLANTDGWSYDEFVGFWQEAAVGASLVSVDTTAPSRGSITATVDFALPSGATSRESVRVTFDEFGDGGQTLMTSYEVLSTERIP